MNAAPQGRDDESYFGALDFGDEISTEPQAANFFDEDVPATPPYTETAEAIELLSADTDHDETGADRADPIDAHLVTVTNPAETVSVSARAGGEVHRVELAPEAVRMTASELAREILAIAQVAQNRGKARFYTELLAEFNERGAVDNDSLAEFLKEGMGLPSPVDARETQAKVFATRYAGE